MSRVRRAITAFFFLFSSINVFFYYYFIIIIFYRGCMPVESPFPLLFPKSWVCVCGGGGGGAGMDVQARVVYVSE